MNIYHSTVQYAAASGIVCWLLIAGIAASQQSNTPPPAEPAGVATESQVAASDDAPTLEAEEHKTLLVNEKNLRLTVPASWKVVEPRNNIIELELAISPRDDNGQPAESSGTTDDAQPRRLARLTMMAAGGDVDANMRRWVGQFRLGRDANGKDAMQRKERRLRGAVAHVLDIAGTYFDSPQGPFGPKVELPDYRMLGAIIEIEGAGKYFVKLYGPAELIEENREAFEQMLASLEVLEPPTAAAPPANDGGEAAAATQGADS